MFGTIPTALAAAGIVLVTVLFVVALLFLQVAILPLIIGGAVVALVVTVGARWYGTRQVDEARVSQ